MFDLAISSKLKEHNKKYLIFGGIMTFVFGVYFMSAAPNSGHPALKYMTRRDEIPVSNPY